MRLTFTFLIIYIFCTSLKAQTAKDFFIPKSPNNKASFFTPSNTGGRTDMTRIIYYVDGEDKYEITDAKMFSGSPTSIQTMSVIFKDDEVKMVKSISTSFSETKKTKDYSPGVTIFKLPKTDQDVSWSYTSISGDQLTCVSKWTSLNIDGNEVKAVMIEQEIAGLGAKTIEYYVKGIGLFKTELQGSNGISKPIEVFEGLAIDSSIN